MNAVHDPADRTAELLQLLDDVALAVAAMDHDGQVVLVGEAQVAVEPFLLLGEGSAVPVPVQACFADRDHTGLGDQVEDERASLAGRLRPRRWDEFRRRRRRPGGPERARVTPALEAAVVPMAMICVTPAPTARSSTPSRSARSRRSSR